MVEVGLEPGSDRSAAEMAGLLGLSRESVHQLLAPYVRAGLLVAVRGRTGGYRAGAGLLGTPALGRPGPVRRARRPARRRRAGPGSTASSTPWKRRPAGARLAVYERVTVGDLVARLRAEREALDWEI